MQIDWQEYKEFRIHREEAGEKDKFYILIEFLKSFYNLHSLEQIYEIVKKDTLSSLMLKKNNILSYNDFEDYIQKYKKY